ncbi:hypothetical protein [Abyssalbus ytuae]|uniref:YhhN-like protein n=1 Tax=Abyssalbus ytuae TaxID=2926907 RepID=A0A9E6ZNN9_9FLAO|nr:hypothetical protein [Abyssalbus ytuae]UOB17685.1 hypothetical protein MQE35_18330 [Abyssalbus ytuae]
MWFIYFNYSVKDIFGEALGNFYTIGVLYSISLSLFSVIALVSYYNNEDKTSLLAVIIAMSFVLADIFMGINIFLTPAKVYEILNVIFQIGGYYFLYLFGKRLHI